DAVKLNEAQREYQRLLVLEPDSADWQHGLAKVLLSRRGKGDLARARELLQKLVERSPRSTLYRTQLANLLVDLGADEAARKVLREGLAETPESAELESALLALGEAGAMEPYRIDGPSAIRAFAEQGDAFAAEPAALVLDRTVTRVLPTGAR